jgi:hypothetical protein
MGKACGAGARGDHSDGPSGPWTEPTRGVCPTADRAGAGPNRVGRERRQGDRQDPEEGMLFHSAAVISCPDLFGRGSAGAFGDTAGIGAVEVQAPRIIIRLGLQPPLINAGPGLQAIFNFITANSDATRTVNGVPGGSVHDRDMTRPTTRSPATSVLPITTLCIVAVTAAHIPVGKRAPALRARERDKW